MEHCFFNPSQELIEQETVKILKSGELDCIWDEVPELTETITWKQYQWTDWKFHDKFPVSGATWSLRKPISTDGAWKQLQWTTFTEYPKARGLNFDLTSRIVSACLEEVFQRGNDNREAHVHFLGLLQSWLTFGLVEAIFQKKIRLSYLTRDVGNGRRVFDTRNLTFALYAELRRTAETPSHKRHDMIRRIYKVFEEYDEIIGNIVVDLDTISKDIKTKPDYDTSASLLVVMQDSVIVSYLLREALEHFHTEVQRRLEIPLPTIRTVFRQSPLKILEPISKELHSTGLCPLFIRRSLMTTSVTITLWLMHWASNTGIPKTENHQLCDAEDCSLSNSPDMRRLHGPDCTSHTCCAISPDVQDVYAILERGAIPLLRLRRENGVISIKAKAWSENDTGLPPFVAFSHVWRHGRGSTTEEGLFQCQIDFLWYILTGLLVGQDLNRSDEPTESVLFWIDSLCIPSSLTHRKMAIRGINKIFSSAEQVLVIDKTLIALSEHELESSSLYAAVATCAWQTRLWTFLEGYVAPALSFVLGDGLFVVRGETAEAHPKVSLPEHMNRIRVDLAQIYSTVAKMAITNRKTPHEKIGPDLLARESNLMADVVKRSTTKEEDEPLVLAACFGLDVRAITMEDGEQRMCSFLRQMGKIPTCWIFQGLKPLNVQPFQWAPKSFLQQNRRFIVDPHTYSDVTPKGLLTSLPCIIFARPQDCIMTKDQGGGMIKTLFKRQLHSRIRPLRAEPESYIWDQESQSDMVILNRPIDTNLVEELYLGLLAKRLNSDDGQIVCKVIQSVRVIVEKKYSKEEKQKAVWTGAYRSAQRLRLI